MRNHWKTIFVAAGLALAFAARGPTPALHAADGLYTAPEGRGDGESARDSPTARSADAYLNSLDPQAKLRERRDEATARRRAEATSSSTATFGAGNEQWVPWTLNPREQAVLAVCVAAALVVSLAAGIYVWRGRMAKAGAAGPVLLGVVRPDLPAPRPAEDQQQAPPRRRAA